MNPDLVCQILVQTTRGERRRGSGYPITPNCIITAAHVVADAAYKEDPTGEGAARHITLTFGVQKTPIDTSVSMVWCGTDVGVDIAVLSCQLPITLQPAHELLTVPPKTPLAWHAQGYTEFGKAKRPGGKDAYDGMLPKFSAAEPTVALGCTEGLVTAQQWAGGSGSVVFDTSTSPTALAVITTYQSGKTRDQLIAVPFCYLLNSQATRDGFRRAIRFQTYERRKAHRDAVMDAVASQLHALEEHTLKRVAQEIDELSESGTSGINLDLDKPALAKETAVYIVSHKDVTDVIGCLDSLVEDLGHVVAEPIAVIIDHLLPLNYAPGVIHRLHEQLAADQLGLIESAVATRTLAEIIMAGYDQQPAKFVACTDGNTDVRGETALDYPDGPEEGPGQAGAESISVLREVRNLLYDLLDRRDTLLGGTSRTQPRTTASARSEAELQVEIQDYATRLRGALRFVSKRHRGRTVYCLLKLPSENNPQRDFRKRVLGEVRTHVPQLLFVELMERATEDREFEVGEYYRARVIRTQHMRKL